MLDVDSVMDPSFSLEFLYVAFFILDIFLPTHTLQISVFSAKSN